MAQAAADRSLNGVQLIVYCANQSEVRRIKRLFMSMGGDTTLAKFVTPSTDTRGMDGFIMWDHYAIDTWEIDRIREIQSRAAGLRESQAW
jgi:hypothetical protein